jgi:hypothetical protein
LRANSSAATSRISALEFLDALPLSGAGTILKR